MSRKLLGWRIRYLKWRLVALESRAKRASSRGDEMTHALISARIGLIERSMLRIDHPEARTITLH